MDSRRAAVSGHRSGMRAKGRFLSLALTVAAAGCAKTIPQGGGLPPLPPDDGGASVVTAAQLTALTGSCTTPLSHAYAFDEGSSLTTTICGLKGAVFWTADMDVDCDGKVTPGVCDKNRDPDFQDGTAFQNLAGQALTASVTPYVVIPNDFTNPGLDPNSGGNVVAVIYQGKLLYAVWGDTGPPTIIGEASYAAAAKLGIDPDPHTGGADGRVVTYIAFLGPGAVPHNIEDQAETATLGARLAAALVAANH
jgi:hypothetical protein